MAQNEQYIWNFFKKEGLNDFGIAGLMGNLLAESALDPQNLQNSYNNSLHMTDSVYTKKVDNNIYKDFVHDCAGYGLAQWTWWTRKQALLSYARRTNRSIGDLQMQLEFLIQELKEKFSTVYMTLKNAKSVREASNSVLLKFECPADQGLRMQDVRASYGETFYKKYSGIGGKINMTQTYRKGVPVQLSTHFKSTEMDCHGNSCCSETLINPRLIEYLEKLREHFNKPISITSGYRCPIHNGSVSGATGSRHTKGDAADIVISGIAPREVAKYAESIGILGIGLYETNRDGHFVHIDTRDYKSFWYGQRQEGRSTFGGASGGNQQPIAPSTPSTTIYTLGSKGPGVQQLQKDLEALGYDIGTYGADGQYGSSTQIAVKNFQRDHHLSPDGIAGPDTLNMIEKELSSHHTEGKIMEVTASALNVRKYGSISAPIVSMIRKGQRVKVIKEEEGWGNLETPQGWVSMDYLK